MTVRVAPREIVDYVERAARVGGCDPSAADLLAHAVTFAHVHIGHGLGAFNSVDDLVAMAAAFSALEREALELFAADRGVRRRHRLTTPVVGALLARFVDVWSGHGVQLDCGLGSNLVVEVGMTRTTSVFRSEQRRDEYQCALADGVLVDASEWTGLVDAAAGFLATESILDAPLD